MHVEEPAFLKGQKVLCFHGPLLYEAIVYFSFYRFSYHRKILKVINEKGQVVEDFELLKYFVHYKGWKTKWDEWVPESRIVRLNESGLRLAKSLRKEKGKSALIDIRRQTRKVESDFSENEEPLSVNELPKSEIKPINVTIGDFVRRSLARDWENVTKKQHLHLLPSHPSASSLIEMFLKENPEDLFLKEFCHGLKSYFDKILPRILLFRFERFQLMEMKKKNPAIPFCEFYGATHLARLFVKLPIFIADSGVYAEGTFSLIKRYGIGVQMFLDFLERNHSTFFNSSAVQTDNDYLNKIRNL